MLTDIENKTATRLRSMTGFAQTIVREDGFVLSLSLRSVNHKTLDLHVHIPEPLQAIEPAVRREISKLHPRGHLQFKATLERESGAAPSINEELIGEYIEVFRRIAAQHDLSLQTAMQALSQLPGVVTVTASAASAAPPPSLQAVFLNALERTLRDWDEMRAGEGAVLEQDLRDRALRIVDSVEHLERLRENTIPVAQKRFRERLDAWLGQETLDSARVAQEAAALAEHTDVSEEILRLRAHFAQFVTMLDGNGEAGKKLDFLLQEIQREINTLLAKTAGLGESGLPMTQAALDIKGEAEKLREQVQNVQ
ncbi:MAG: YicC family protein [Acidobacteria bacterium]|nr:YicC family protein [Acidobacteriota bacterium]